MVNQKQEDDMTGSGRSESEIDRLGDEVDGQKQGVDSRDKMWHID